MILVCASLDKLQLLGIVLVFQINVTFKDSYRRKQTYEINLPLVWMAGKSEVAVHNLTNEL